MEVQFITSSPDLKGRPELILPEFAFIGRSNCGKSSLINHFLDRNKIAKTSIVKLDNVVLANVKAV